MHSFWLLLFIIKLYSHINVSKIKTFRLFQTFRLFSHNTDAMFLFENVLDSLTEATAPKINIPGYNLVGFDHPSNTKRGAIFMFYKEYLPVNTCDGLCMDVL